jgi:hypothetical protein
LSIRNAWNLVVMMQQRKATARDLLQLDPTEQRHVTGEAEAVHGR